jgi:hypothetical protein
MLKIAHLLYLQASAGPLGFNDVQVRVISAGDQAAAATRATRVLSLTLAQQSGGQCPRECRLAHA